MSALLIFVAASLCEEVLKLVAELPVSSSTEEQPKRSSDEVHVPI